MSGLTRTSVSYDLRNTKTQEMQIEDSIVEFIYFSKHCCLPVIYVNQDYIMAVSGFDTFYSVNILLVCQPYLNIYFLLKLLTYYGIYYSICHSIAS